MFGEKMNEEEFLKEHPSLKGKGFTHITAVYRGTDPSDLHLQFLDEDIHERQSKSKRSY